MTLTRINTQNYNLILLLLVLKGLLLLACVADVKGRSARRAGGDVARVEPVERPPDEGQVLLLEVLVRDTLVEIATVVVLEEIGCRLVLEVVKVRLEGS